MSYPQHYKTLGVNQKASPEEIRTAYRKLAKRYHPDTHKGDKKSEEKLKTINEAYNVLKDLAKRVEYDYWGRQAAENTQPTQKNTANSPFTRAPLILSCQNKCRNLLANRA